MADSDKPSGIDRRAVLRTGVTGALLAGGAASPAAARTLVVDDDGTADYTTINAAVGAASSGDTVVVRPGTYRETVRIPVPNLALSGRGAAVVVGDGTASPAVSVEADGVTVERLRVRNPGGLLGVKVQPADSGVRAGVTVRGNRVSDVGPFGRLGVSGIITGGDQRNLAVVGNTVTGLRENAVSAQGIFLDDEAGGTVGGTRVAGNVVRNVSAAQGAIGVLLQTPTAGSLAVVRNRVRGMDGGVFAQGVDVDATGGFGARMAFNTFESVSGGQFPGEGVKIDGGGISGLTVTRNNLLPPVGANNALSTTLSAECNYWDSPSGPEAEDNPGGSGSRVLGAVDYRPWSVGRVGAGGGGATCRGG